MSDILSRGELAEDLAAERQRAARLQAELIQARQRADLAEASARTAWRLASWGARRRPSERREAVEAER